MRPANLYSPTSEPQERVMIFDSRCLNFHPPHSFGIRHPFPLHTSFCTWVICIIFSPDSPKLCCSELLRRVLMNLSPLCTSIRKRQRSDLSMEEFPSDDDGVWSSDDDTTRSTGKRRRKSSPRILTEVRLPGLIFPKSMYRNHDTPDTFDSEEAVLSDLLVS